MLDEEVRFEKVKKIPLGIIRKDLHIASNIVTVTAGVVGGGHLLGLAGAGCCAFPLGLIVGGSVGYFVNKKFVSKIAAIPDKLYSTIDDVLNEVARHNGAASAEFEYRGNKIEVVIKPKHEMDGHIYYMDIDDNYVGNPTFSYQPRRSCLSFKFNLPRLSNGEGHMDLEENDKTVEFIESLQKNVADGYKLGIQYDHKLHLTLSFKTSDYRKELTRFALISSKLMNESKEYIEKRA